MAEVTVKYRCHKCVPGTVVSGSAVVAERRPGEDIKTFMDRAMLKCQQMHLLGSPSCQARHMDLMLPLSQNGIGMAGPELTPEEMEDFRRQVKERP